MTPHFGIELDEILTSAEKLKIVRELMEKDDPRAAAYKDIGIYLTYSVVRYCQFYDIHHLMFLGHAISSKGSCLTVFSLIRILNGGKSQ